MTAKFKKPRMNVTLPILFLLSVLLNYGQYSGWVTIANPGVAVPLYVSDAYGIEPALPPATPVIDGGCC